MARSSSARQVNGGFSRGWKAQGSCAQFSVFPAKFPAARNSVETGSLETAATANGPAQAHFFACDRSGVRRLIVVRLIDSFALDVVQMGNEAAGALAREALAVRAISDDFVALAGRRSCTVRRRLA